MKSQSYRNSLASGCSIAGLAVAAALAPTGVNAITISLDPATQQVGVGNSFGLSVRISGLGNLVAPSLGAFDLDVIFDPGLAQLDSVFFGDPNLGDLLAPLTASVTGSLPTSGSVNLFGVSLDDPFELDSSQPNQFVLATLHFTALQLGDASFNLENHVLGDANGNALALGGFSGANVRVVPQTVPEGGPGWIGALALGLLAFGHRRLGHREGGS